MRLTCALLRHHHVDEAGALVGEPVVVVAPARRGQQDVHRRDRPPPRQAVRVIEPLRRVARASKPTPWRTPRTSRTGRAAPSASTSRASLGTGARSALPSPGRRPRGDRRRRYDAAASTDSRRRTPRRVGSSSSRPGRTAGSSPRARCARRCTSRPRRANASTRAARSPALRPERRTATGSGRSSETRQPTAVGVRVRPHPQRAVGDEGEHIAARAGRRRRTARSGS